MKSVVLAAAFAAAVVSGSAFAEEPLYCVEWMESDGSQQIVLPITGQANLRYEMKMQWLSPQNASGFTFLGCQDLVNGVYNVPFTTAFSRRFAYLYSMDSAAYVKCAKNENIEPRTSICVLTATMMDGVQTFQRDGIEYRDDGYETVTGLPDTDVPLGLFGRYGRDAKGNLGFVSKTYVSMRFYYLKIWDKDDNLIFEGRPGVMEDGTYELYDFVSKRTYPAENGKVFTSGGGRRWNTDSQDYDLCKIHVETSVDHGSCAIDKDPYIDDWYRIGTVLTITATPEDGYRFLKWNGDYQSDRYASVQTLTIQKEFTLAPVFIKDDGKPLVRHVAVTPEGKADGTSWENAGSFAEMLGEVRAYPYGGVLKLKKGCYGETTGKVEVFDNLTVVGGYAGEEVEEEPDAEMNQTILHGPKTYQWSAGGYNNNTGTLIVDTERGVYNLPPEGYPATTEWWQTGNGGGKYSFYKTSGSAKNVTIANLVFATSNAQVIDFTSTEMDGFVVSNCTFVSCCLSQACRVPTAQVGNSPGEIVDCKFIGTCIPLVFKGTDRSSEVTARGCRFFKNRQCQRGYDDCLASGVMFIGDVNAIVDGCHFVSNVAAGTFPCGSAFYLAGNYPNRKVLIRNSIFDGNVSTNSGVGVGYIASTGGRLTIDGCQFVGNTGGTCFHRESSTYLQVKNCYIAKNTCDRPTAGESTYKSSVFTAGTTHRYSVEFVNCTVESNAVCGSAIGYNCHTMVVPNGKPTHLALVNCLFRDNDCFCADGTRCTDVYSLTLASSIYAKNATLNVVNSIFTHQASDYVAIAYDSSTCVSHYGIYANSYLQGTELTGTPYSGCRAWVSDILTDVEGAPKLMADYKYSAAGTPALGIADDSPLRRKGVKVYEGTDGKSYIYNKTAGEWQALHTDFSNAQYYLTAEQVEEQGLSLDNPVIADALGMERRCKKVSPGPVDFPAPGLMLLVR